MNVVPAVRHDCAIRVTELHDACALRDKINWITVYIIYIYVTKFANDRTIQPIWPYAISLNYGRDRHF